MIAAGVPALRFGRMPRWAGPLPLTVGIAVIAVWIVLALGAPWLAPYDPFLQDLAVRLQPPGALHPFGTDNFGRDILSRVIWSARVDLTMGVIGVAFPFLIGTGIGAVAGYFGGAVDLIFMRILDMVLAFPFLVLVLAILAILGPGLTSFYIALALVGWVSYARLIRAQVLVVKGSDFVIAARSLGYSHLRIMFRHVLPNSIVASIVFAMSDIVLVVLSGSAISYLGLGVQPPTAEWGVMIAEGQSYISTAWWITTFPGVAIVLMAFGFSMLADGLGEKLGLDG
ncbi:ABC transporter permease [Dongia sedimenti]|uniref:ABC transporter permease n=1 Tax=Dongia sedimenti TaxID=3064282 RepID=A0ABU0YG44_9PROT|nr:ABC transporter permease [Rhodospirillaceae bacterium R-7]